MVFMTQNIMGVNLRNGYQRAYIGYVDGKTVHRDVHRIIVENALGRSLPDKAVIHHCDNDPLNNNLSNFVVCEDQQYHLLIHLRKRAIEACGHPDWRKCPYCKQWDDPQNMYHKKATSTRRASYQHRACNNFYKKQLKERRLLS